MRDRSVTQVLRPALEPSLVLPQQVQLVLRPQAPQVWVRPRQVLALVPRLPALEQQ